MAIINGKFHGTTPATTPIGSLTIKLVIDGSVAETLPKVLSINSPYHWKCIGASLATSFKQSFINFPVSTHSSTEFSTPCFLNNSANLSKVSFLCSGAVFDQIPFSKVFLATLTAKSTSFWLHFATEQSVSPVAGFIFSNFCPSTASTYFLSSLVSTLVLDQTAFYITDLPKSACIFFFIFV